MITRLWSKLMYWFEHGDLVPLIVIVSAVHFTAILSGKDIQPVAIAIGLLVDLGTYRWVRAATRYQGANQRHRAARWLLAIGMSGLALLYHQRYYADIWLAAPLPLLVISLAWLAEMDKRPQATPKPVISEPIIKPAEPEPAISASSTLPAGKYLYVCGLCGRSFAGQQGLNAHQRAHVRENGREKVTP